MINDRTHPHITAKIIADSIGPNDTAPRLTTFEITYPRYIHAEIMTNRILSKNAQSSRAIPVQRRLERVSANPVKPIFWGANQAGMQSKVEEVEKIEECHCIWMDAVVGAVQDASDLMARGLHKQWANRLLEPFDTITIISTATNFANMFALRCHGGAQPEFQDLAWKMADLYFHHKPNVIGAGDWHLPYVSADELIMPELASDTWREHHENTLVLLKASVARCARVSYLNHDGSSPDLEKDIALHDKLLADHHMSPFEHQAKCSPESRPDAGGNFAQGWVQYRKTLPGECLTFDEVDYRQRRAALCPDRPIYTGE